MIKKIVSVLAMLCLVQGVCFGECIFEYEGITYSIFEDRVEVEKDGALYVITEDGVIAPEGGAGLVCFVLMWPILLGLIACNPVFPDLIICSIGIFGAFLLALCASM